MTYTNNVPQANQTIAATQVPILNNFAYIDTEQKVEHAFNNVPFGQATGTHLRCSMPNQVDPVALPTGCSGIYYVSGGLPKFYNGTAFNIQIPPATQSPNVITGSVALTTSNTVLTAIPPNSSGTYFIIPPAGKLANTVSASGAIVSSATDLQIGQINDPGLTISESGMNLRARTDSSTNNGTYKFIVVYYTP